ncbi:hypothetical protein OKA05_03965 [Luteolibacter arcticus]|uniref:Uncharacterized protein n=1 Tax=Luteolibacter arcticus TaxID=1581411 RepID=A0ABT3GEG5_9BACT|nr:hypothetical protein [Luteolibacter arcticus]MCW1921695.1 hypothetical protein [Luteolibacter arcticus]
MVYDSNAQNVERICTTRGMGKSSEEQVGQWIGYCWPPVIGISALVAGHITASSSPKAFMSTHGFFEIAIVIAFLASIIYVIRLRPFRRDRWLRIPFYANWGMLALTVVGIISVFAGEL